MVAFRNSAFGLAVICLAALYLSACGSGPTAATPSRVSIMSYNVQSLFDAVDSGREFAGFSVARGQWDEKAYRLRLRNLARVIMEAPSSAKGIEAPTAASPCASGADILCLMELENPRVLEDLARGPLGGGGWNWRAMAPAPESPINTGILSRYPVLDRRAHALAGDATEGGGRNILEVRIDVHGSPLVIFACHWKSRSGGEESTEGLRRAAAGLVGRRIAELHALEGDLRMIVCGDFNESPDEFLRSGGRGRLALMPYDAAGGSADSDRLLVCSRAAEAGWRGREALLYSPWEEAGGWSYSFRGRQERIDGFLLSDSLLAEGGLRFHSFSALPAPFLLSKGGTALPWSGKRRSGYSDHLPILLVLEEG